MSPSHNLEKIDANDYFLTHTRQNFDLLPRVDILTALLENSAQVHGRQEQEAEFSKILDLVARQKRGMWPTYAQTIHDTSKGLNFLIKIPTPAKIEQAIKRIRKAKAKEPPQYEPLIYVQRIKSKMRTISSNKISFLWNGKVYEAMYQEELDKIIIDELMADYGTKVHLSQVAEIRSLLQIKTFVRPEAINRAGLLILQNGRASIETGVFNSGHSPDDYATILLAASFDPKAQCPQWLKMIESSLPEKPQRMLLQEWIGYSLSTSNSYEKALIMLGGGGNGKSEILEVWEALLGPENCSALSLDDLGHNFRLIELQHRLVNFTYEADMKGLLSDNSFKAIVTGEPIMGERKHKDPVKFRPSCKMVVSGNRLPKTNDKSYGFQRRLCILPFEMKFKDAHEVNPSNPREKVKIPDIALEVIRDELPGVLNWALAGYARLRKQGHFTEPDASKQVLREYQMTINPALRYVDERLEQFDSEDKLLLSKIYADYLMWCSDNGHKYPVAARSLAKTIEAEMMNGPSLEPTKTKHGKAYFGLKLATDS